MALLVARSNKVVQRASFKFLVVVVVVVVDLGVPRENSCRDVPKSLSGARLRVFVLRAVNSGVAVSRSCGGEVQRWGGKGGVGGGERMRGSCIRELSGRREEGRGQGAWDAGPIRGE